MGPYTGQRDVVVSQKCLVYYCIPDKPSVYLVYQIYPVYDHYLSLYTGISQIFASRGPVYYGIPYRPSVYPLYLVYKPEKCCNSSECFRYTSIYPRILVAPWYTRIRAREMCLFLRNVLYIIIYQISLPYTSYTR